MDRDIWRHHPLVKAESHEGSKDTFRVFHSINRTFIHSKCFNIVQKSSPNFIPAEL